MSILIKLLAFLKKWRKRIFIVVFLVVLIVLIVWSRRAKPTQVLRPSPTPVDIGSQFTGSNFGGGSLTSNIYFLNKLEIPPRVDSYTWVENRLVYLSGKKIYSAQTKQPIFTQEFDQVSFGLTTLAVGRVGNAWFLLDIDNAASTPLPIDSNLDVTMLRDGSAVVYRTGNTITRLDLRTKEKKTISGANTQAILVPSNGANFGVVRDDGSQGTFTVYNAAMSTIFAGTFPTGQKVLAYNPSGFFLVANGATLFIYDTQGILQVYTFTEGSQLLGQWIDSDNCLIIERLKPDNLGRSLENIWRTSATRGVDKLIDTRPIPAKLRETQDMVPDPEFKAAGLIDKNGNFWLLSLIPNNMAGYNINGIISSPLSNEPQDDHGDE